MKILYLTNSRIPTEKAHGLQIIRMCEAFANNGHHLQLIVPKRLNLIKKDVFEFYNSKNNFKIIFLPIIDTVGLGKFGFIFEAIQFTVGSTIYSLFKKNDLVFTRDEILAAFNILIGKKVYWESHTGAYGFFAKFVLKKADKIIVISEGLEDFYKEKGVSEDRMVVAHDGVRVEDFQFNFNKNNLRDELNLPKNNPLIMYTGHLYDWKGADLLAKASEVLKNYNFIFIGGTDLDLESFKRKYRNKNILFVGFVENKFIPKYLKTADLLIIPNIDNGDISSKFTSPLKFFEYIASGVPILASDLISLKNIGKDKVDYFKAGDLDDLIKNIKVHFHGGCKHESDNLYLYSWEERVKKIIER